MCCRILGTLRVYIPLKCDRVSEKRYLEWYTSVLSKSRLGLWALPKGVTMCEPSPPTGGNNLPYFTGKGVWAKEVERIPCFRNSITPFLLLQQGSCLSFCVESTPFGSLFSGTVNFLSLVVRQHLRLVIFTEWCLLPRPLSVFYTVCMFYLKPTVSFIRSW